MKSIKLAREEAWKEFERTGELVNSADGILEAFDSLEGRLIIISDILNSDLTYSHEDIERMRRLTVIP